jgi:GGDEF domain-containing protein
MTRPRDEARGATGARRALLEAARHVAPSEPMAASFLRETRRLTGSSDVQPLLSHWSSRALGNPTGTDRYRWELTHQRGTGFPGYLGPPQTWRAWRSSEQPVLERDPFAFEERLTAPIVACESAELLAESREIDPRAVALLEEADSVLRRDFASLALERNAWADTFGLYCLTRYTATFERLYPIATAVAETYALRAERSGGVVTGTRFPLHDRKLCSASAQLAAALLALGSHTDVVASCVDFVAGECTASGGFGDAADPPDVLTTLVAAELLARTDPGFSLEAGARFFLERQEESGLFRALGPELPWLTGAIANWLDDSERPFCSRFRFPHAPLANLDKKTGLPFFAYFTEVARLFSALSGLSAAQVPVAFVDLVGFRAFNNRFGQAMGDEVLGFFAHALAGLGETRAIRDGGDEFLIVGAPTSRGLEQKFDALQRAWPTSFRQRFGSDAPPVLARVLVSSTRGQSLLSAREALGRAIGELKHAPLDADYGILRSVELQA